MESDYMIGIFKFIDKNYSDDFENNNLYFNSLKTYHDISDEAVGDALEGIMSDEWGDSNDENALTMYYKIGDSEEVKVTNFSTAVFKIKPNDIDKIYIDCFTVLMRSDLENVDKDKNIFRIKPSYIEGLAKIIKNRNIYLNLEFKNFLNKVDEFSKKNNIPIKGDDVKYYSKKHPLYYKHAKVGISSLKELLDVAFYKTEKYKYQREYRIALYNIENNLMHIEGIYENWFEVKELSQINFVIGDWETVQKYAN
ncbi:hypothetical protein [Staphylococcus gallinarum]|uniref:hypothetical protein n=1 Tax=Staphylococcus gallinarum TaxID=1293 RepID=UPI0030BFC3AE